MAIATTLTGLKTKKPPAPKVPDTVANPMGGVVGEEMTPISPNPIDEDLSADMSKDVDPRENDHAPGYDIGDNNVPDTPGNVVENMADNERQRTSGDDLSWRDTRDIDALAEDFVTQQFQRGLTGGDTTEQERLIREGAAGALGQGLVNSRARAGRSGFATSGMQMALEQDARSSAERQAALDVIDARIAESQRGIDNALAAGRYDLAAQAQATQDALTAAKIDAFNSIVDNNTPDPQMSGSSSGSVASGIGAGANPAESLLATDIDSGLPATESERENARAVNVQPEGSVLVHSDGSGNYYRTPSGEVVVVRIATAGGG